MGHALDLLVVVACQVHAARARISAALAQLSVALGVNLLSATVRARTT